MITWLFEEDSFSPIAKIRNSKHFSIVNDHLGTPYESYDDKGDLVWSRELNANGKVLKETGIQNFCPFLYQGQSFDAEIELAYNRFRYYDPEDGKYISQDPIGLLSGEFGFYNYVEDTNDWLDVFGLMPRFSNAVKDEIIKENSEHFNVNKCEQCKQNVIKPKKSKRGVKPPKNEWQIDHIDPDSLGGSNKGENGQLLCRRCNRKKSNKNNNNFKNKNRQNRRKKGYGK